jgi:hypothetical protein
MTRIFTYLFLLAASYAFAQITIEPASLEVKINETKTHIFNMVVTNKSAKDIDIFWILQKGTDFPASWKTVMCDAQLCYDENADKIDPRRPNRIKPGENLIIKLDFIPGGFKGSSTMQVRLYDDKDFKNLVAQTKPNAVVVADAVSSTLEKGSNDDLLLYPNPTENFFYVNSDQFVSKLVYYNILSKEIRSEYHAKGQAHDITDLNKGVYFIRMLDNKGKVLKSVRLNKR